MSIETRLRLGKLDSLMLYLPSVIGLSFSLLQYVVFGTNLLIYYIPILFFGICLPIYIGYIRGAIKLDSITERARGWIYFVGGIISYCIIIVNQLIIVPEKGLFPQLTSFLLIGGIAFTIQPLSRHIGKEILNCFDHKITEIDERKFNNTGWAAFLLSFSFVQLVNFRIEEFYDGLSPSVYIISLWMYMAFSLEFHARKISDGFRTVSPKELLNLLIRSNFAFFLIYSILIPFILIFITIYFEKTIIGYPFVNGLIIISILVGCSFTS